ncbi:methyltransferase [Sphaerisporangium rufum]|uniref:Methyltransferase n=2 Tax=Sphaerisporangium rufum TaxID=1381558 RepID=A0A919V2B4_9ACTN|nr:methyltransferase [Sphaerisporangium rufum]
MSTLSPMLADMSNEHATVENEDPALLRLLDTADALPGAAMLRAWTYELLRPAPGAAVVDVGCGGGRAVAELVERGANAIGVDADPRMVAAARRRWPGTDVRLGDAADLPLGDCEVHGYRADKVLHELLDPVAALVEARRVLAPGGRIVLVGQDWDTIVIDSADPALTRAMVHARADTVASPRVARACRNLLLDGGFTEVTVEVRTAVFTGDRMLPMLRGLAETARAAGVDGRERVDGWLADQERRAAADRLFIALPLFITAATRP